MKKEKKELQDKIDKLDSKIEIKNGIKYTTHFINRPIKQGDPMSDCIGTSDNIIEIINYIYQ